MISMVKQTIDKTGQEMDANIGGRGMYGFGCGVDQAPIEGRQRPSILYLTS